MSVYNSVLYELTPFYERFGNFYLNPGLEIFLYITDISVSGVEPNRYSISNKMRVYDYKKKEFVKISYNTQYPTVNLYNVTKNKTNTYLLHRIYMLTFCYFPGCENYEVNHIDGNKNNCAPYNLEWRSHAGNMRHAFEFIIERKITDEDIIAIINMYNSGNKIKDIAREFNISTGYVMDLVRRNTERSSRLTTIRKIAPVTRKKRPVKLTEELLEIIANRYNNGEEYFELAKEYDIDRSYLTKAIKRYAKTHPEIKIRDLKVFTPEMANLACQIFVREFNKGNMSPNLYKLVLDELGLEYNENNRKAISNLYNGKTYRDISSNYNYR